MRIPVEFDYPGGTSAPSGGYGYGGGSSQAGGSSLRSASVASSRSSAIHITVVSQLDGREVARNQVRHLPSMLALQGV
jgi:hypothetical protein